MDDGSLVLMEAAAENLSISPLSAVQSARSGMEFGVDLEVRNAGADPFFLHGPNPVTLSYRWFDMASGNPLHPEGGRTHLDEFLAPASAQTIHLRVVAPAFAGMATLRISLVWEGRFWFYEAFPTGWTDCHIQVDYPATWPEDLRGSVASKALRGALVANTLKALLAADPLLCMKPLTTADAPEPAMPERAVPPMPELARLPVFAPQPAFEPLTSAKLPQEPPQPHPETRPSEEVSSHPALSVPGPSRLRRMFGFFERYIRDIIDTSPLMASTSANQRLIERLLDRQGALEDKERQTQQLLQEVVRIQETQVSEYARRQHAHIERTRQDFNILMASSLAQLSDQHQAVVRHVVAADANISALADQLLAFREAVRSDLARHEVQQTALSESVASAHASLRSVLQTLRRLQLMTLTVKAELLAVRGGQDATAEKQHALEAALIDAANGLEQALLAAIENTHQTLSEQLNGRTHALQHATALLADQVAGNHLRLNGALSTGLQNISAVQREQFDGLLKNSDSLLNSLSQHLGGLLTATGAGLDGRLAEQSNSLDAGISAILTRIDSGRDAIAANITALLSAGADREQVHLVTSLNNSVTELRHYVETHFGFAFAKLDAGLHRQVFSVPARELTVCRNAAGLFALPAQDLEVASYFASGALPEPGSLAIVERLLQPGDVFVDVGANVGLFSVVAARRVGRTGKVFSFEPVPETMKALSATIYLNGLADIVTPFPYAAGSKPGSARINLGRTCGHSSFLPLEDTQQAIDVEVVALDDVIEGARVDLIKIDVEGWELHVLDGLRRTLAANPNASILLEFGPAHLRRAGTDPQTWLQHVRSFGRNVYEIDEATASVQPLRKSGIDSIESINLLLSSRPASLLDGRPTERG
jgi:FkbM family methyltransferase